MPLDPKIATLIDEGRGDEIEIPALSGTVDMLEELPRPDEV